MSRQTQIRHPHRLTMGFGVGAISALMMGLMAAPAIAQAPGNTPQAACPPGISSDAPVVGRDDPNETLSEELAKSKGIICPPAGIDPEMHKKPPEGGAIEIIRPPGTPGGDPSVQPK